MTARGTLTAIPGGIDQVARWRAFKAANPSAEYSHRLSEATWTGGMTVAHEWRAVSSTGLERVIDALEVLAELDAGAKAIEAQFPGWHVRVCEHAGHRHWEAADQKKDSRYPLGGPVICQDSAAALRAALAEFCA